MVKKTPKIFSILIKSSDGIYPFKFPAQIIYFRVSSRNGNVFKLAFELNSFNPSDSFSQGDFLTIQEKQSKEFGQLQLSSEFNIFLACDIPGEVIEIEYWR